MTKTTTCVYHFLVLNWYIFLNYYIPHIGKDEEKLKEFHDGGRSKYLTLLNLAVFFGVACLDDVLKRIIGRKDIKFITSFRDLLFTTLAFPVSTFVFLVFWTLFHYDRSLVYPEGLDDFFPAWVNHAMHTSILPFSLVEAILRPHHYPSKKLGLALLGTCNIAYIIRILWRYSQTGNWVYPVFAYLSPLGIIIFFSAAYILNAGIYLLGEKINHWKWDTNPPTEAWLAMLLSCSVGCLFTLLFSAAVQLPVWELEHEITTALPDLRCDGSDSHKEEETEPRKKISKYN